VPNASNELSEAQFGLLVIRYLLKELKIGGEANDNLDAKEKPLNYFLQQQVL
jgi:hypothetical protein